MTNKARLVVLISGGGSNLQAIIDACETGHLPAQVVGVICNKANVYGLQRAENHHIPTKIHAFRKGESRAEYDAILAKLVQDFEPDWVILAGWLRILSMHFLSHLPNKVVNLHPALPGQFAGLHAIERAFTAYQEGEIEETGIMVHFVPDEGVDDGPVLNTAIVPINPDDTLESLETRIHAAEHRLLVETIRQLVMSE